MDLGHKSTKIMKRKKLWLRSRFTDTVQISFLRMLQHKDLKLIHLFKGHLLYIFSEIPGFKKKKS